MVFRGWFLATFEGIFGQEKHYQIAWFLHQLEACNVYYKTQLMLCINRPKPLLMTNPRYPSPCCCVRFCQIFQQFSATHCHHLLPPVLPSSPPPWTATTTTARSPKVAQKQPDPVSALPCVGPLSGHFASHRRPPTATHHLRTPPPTRGCYHQVHRSPMSM